MRRRFGSAALAGLAACGSVMLLATTTSFARSGRRTDALILLSLYLLSFILCFHSDKWYPRLLFGIALGRLTRRTASCSSGISFLISGFRSPLTPHPLVCCMVCHGELAR